MSMLAIRVRILWIKPLLNRYKCNEYEPIENFSFDDFLKKYIELPY